MNLAPVEQIARAVLYEGYALYPYRASAIKNRQRFNFGVLYPATNGGTPPSERPNRSVTECLISGGDETLLEVRVRFLHLRSREMERPLPLVPAANGDAAGREMFAFEKIEVIEIDGCVFSTWQEAEEREFVAADLRVDDLAQRPIQRPFAFAGSTSRESLRNSRGEVVAVAVRAQHTVQGALEISARQLAERVYLIHVSVINQTAGELAADDCQAALLDALVSTHAVLGVRDGEFISLLEPPDEFREFPALCHNQGTWPVLVGEPGQRDLLLSSPIILYDYPQIAPESPGDLFDGTENDELLTLRILSLTAAEKNEVRGLDDRARQLLERTEALPPEQLSKMHGAIRGLRRVREPTQEITP